MALPAGTVFSYYEPCFFRDLYIKDSEPDEMAPDFSISSLVGAVKHDSSNEFGKVCDQMENGESKPVDFEYSGREGFFNDNQLIAIYEKEDVKKLIARLTGTL